MKGIGASPGIAIGKVYLKRSQIFEIQRKAIAGKEEEKEKLIKAIEKSKEEIQRLHDYTMNNIGNEEARIFEAHGMILEDPELLQRTLEEIEQESSNAEYAIKKITWQFISEFEAMDNEYIRERAADIRDVSERIIRNMLGLKSFDLSMLEEETILVAEDLTPSDTAVLDREKVLGFLTDVGGNTSHSAIMARTLEIPAVVGLKSITREVKDGDIVIVDGLNGEVLVNPDKQSIDRYMELRNVCLKEKEQLRIYKDQPTITLDGRKVELSGNIGTPEDIRLLEENGAEGVGLYRTEFLYMGSSRLPSEEEQYQAYKKVLEAMNPKPVIIRTLDIGGDKKLDYMNIGSEMNPFLGYRAIRLCLKEKGIFITQLRALLRAGAHGNLGIMFPMISELEELLEAKGILNEARKQLEAEGMEYSGKIQIGIMIEVPSAAIISDELAKHVDFFSIGTNDLIQYTCAVDRMNEKVGYLYNPMHPAVLRLIKTIIDNGHKEGIWVGMCGEMAGDIKMIPLLLGMGLDEFSMSPSSILPARKLIQSLEFGEVENSAEKKAGRPKSDMLP